MNRTMHAFAGILIALSATGCVSQATTTAASDSRNAVAPVAAIQNTVLPDSNLYELAYSLRQNAVFVASSGFAQAEEDAAAPKIFRLNPENLAIQAVIPVEHRAFGLALDDAADRLYIGNSHSSSITVLDTRTNQVTSVIQLGTKIIQKDGTEQNDYDLRELQLDTARNRLYVPGLSIDDNGALFIIDTKSLRLEKTIYGLGPLVTGIALASDQNRLFLSNLKSELLTIDTGKLEVEKRTIIRAEQPINLAYEPLTHRLFIIDQGDPRIQKFQEEHFKGFKHQIAGNRVLVLDADSGKELTTFASGPRPLALRLDSARKHLYVTNSGASSVAVFDLDNYQQLQEFRLFNEPNSLAYDEVRQVLYVSVKNKKRLPKIYPDHIVRINVSQAPSARSTGH